VIRLTVAPFLCLFFSSEAPCRVNLFKHPEPPRYFTFRFPSPLSFGIKKDGDSFNLIAKKRYNSSTGWSWPSPQTAEFKPFGSTVRSYTPEVIEFCLLFPFFPLYVGRIDDISR